MRNYLTIIHLSLTLTVLGTGRAMPQQYSVLANGTTGQRMLGQIAQSRTTWSVPNPNPMPYNLYLTPAPTGTSPYPAPSRQPTNAGQVGTGSTDLFPTTALEANYFPGAAAQTGSYGPAGASASPWAQQPAVGGGASPWGIVNPRLPSTAGQMAPTPQPPGFPAAAAAYSLLRLPPIAGVTAEANAAPPLAAGGAYPPPNQAAPFSSSPPSTKYTANYPGNTDSTVAYHPVVQAARIINQTSRLGRLSPITVSLEHGVVVLRGQVATENDRALAEMLVRLEPGTGDIRDELTIGLPPPPAESSGRIPSR